MGSFGCSTCHARVMSDGSGVKGAQGNCGVEQAAAYRFRHRIPAKSVHAMMHGLFAVPWLKSDAHSRLDQMSVEEVALSYDAIPPGVIARDRTSPFFPVQIPDLIGLKERHYFDHTDCSYTEAWKI